MSSTYTAQFAADYVTTFIKGMPFDNVSVQVLDDVNKMMWMAAPWRWTLGAFTNVTLLNNTQDYTVALPSDFLYLQTAYGTTADGNPPNIYYVESYLNPGGKLGIPSRVAVVSGSPGGSGTFRVSPQPGTVPAGETIISLYKKQAPLITPANANNAGVLVFDDEWFWVYVSGVLYFAYLYGDDQRAGGAQMGANGQVQFTGQRGVFEANLQIMREREKLPGLETVQPEQRDASGRGN